MALLKGIDVSAAQGDVDWQKVAGSGVRFVYLKATEGEDFVDKRFTAARVDSIRRARARSALSPLGRRLVWGPYHYLRPRRDRSGAVEARHAVAVARSRGWKPGRRGRFWGRDLPMCVDVERGGNETELAAMSGAQLRAYVTAFCAEVHRLTGRGCVTYLSPGFAPELGGHRPTFGYWCWVAAWDAPDGDPPVPAGWSRHACAFHQTNEAGTCPGVDGRVDLDVFVGGPIALRALIAGVRPKGGPPAPVPHEQMTVKEVQQALRRCGWPITVDGRRGPRTRQAIRDFQRGYARVTLTQDGLVGAKTAAALRWSAAHDGHASEHFRFIEFASSHTGWIRTHRDLVRGLEKLRARVDHAIGVLSGFRDFNLGASMSQHKFGNAMDPTVRLPLAAILACRAFSGIGLNPGSPASSAVRHLDVRHVGPNFTNGTPDHPTVFIDAFRVDADERQRAVRNAVDDVQAAAFVAGVTVQIVVCEHEEDC